MEEILGLIMPGVTKIIDKLIPDANARAAAKESIQIELLKQDGAVKEAIAAAVKAQVDVNLEEAKHPSIFVAGWRPAIGWICGGGLGYQFILQPFLVWIALMCGVSQPPSLDIASLMTLVTGMLGLGTLRTYEKYQEVATTKVGGKK